MAAAGSELQEKMRRFTTRTASNSSGVKQVSRAESPARVTDVFRSGWSHVPEVKPPLSFVPQRVGPSAAARSGSCPGGQQRAGQGADPRSTSNGVAVRERRTADGAAGGQHAASPRQRGMVRTPSDRSNLSFQSGSTVAPGGAAVALGRGLHHEGWLSKRTSGKVARWQRRYFTLDGCKLCYSSKPGAPTKRSFDIRRARGISIAESQPRELELDFGFRAWRLSAESPAAAHRWFLMLDAGRLVAGPDAGAGEGLADDWSDEEDNASLASTGTSATSNSSAGIQATVAAMRTPRSFVQQELRPAPSITDRLEVDPSELDRRFEAWLPSRASSSEPLDAAHVRLGLHEALGSLWTSLGARANGRGQRGAGADMALAALAGPPRPEPEALGHAVEGVLGEYLSRMGQGLRRWVEETDPASEEVADVLRWVLFEALPSLEKFDRGAAELAGQELRGWRGLAEEVEHVLLSEWEARACDEIVARCEALRRLPLGHVRAGQTLQILRAALEQPHAWDGSEHASDRAASLPIAALNAVLRSYRTSVRTLIEAPAAPAAPRPAAARRSRSLTSIGSVLREASRGAMDLHKRMTAKKGDDAPVGAPQVAVAAAASEAGSFAEFCAEAARARHGPAAVSAVLADVLEAFAGAFEREAGKLCSMLADVHFAVAHKADLKGLRFQAQSQQQEPAFGHLCRSAERFLDEALIGAPVLCRSLTGEALLHLLMRQWVRQFRVAPPKLSACPALPRLIAADEASLRRLAERSGAEARWDAAAPNPLQPLQEVGSILQAPSPELTAMCTARLEVLLGAEKGRALANAARLAALR